MAELTLSQAVQLIGKSKSTLSRAIKNGRLSARRNGDGTFSIDPAELLRAFPNETPRHSLEQRSEPFHATGVAGLEQAEINALRDELAKAEQRAAVAEAQAEERARALDAAERNLADLRRMLPGPTAPGTAKPSSPFWRRLFS